MAIFLPTKLLVNVRNPKQLKTKLNYRLINATQIEVEALSAREALAFLNENQNDITDFEYRKGSINDAFIKIAGKELQ